MKTIKLLVFITIAILINGCAILKSPTIEKNGSLNSYKYIYVPSSKGLASSIGIYGGQWGTTISNSINPEDIITGALIKRGFVRLYELKQDLLAETLIINYGESGQRAVFMGHTTEITIQFVSAETLIPICTCTAEGFGDTVADDIRKAINRAFKKLFQE